MRANSVKRWCIGFIVTVVTRIVPVRVKLDGFVHGAVLGIIMIRRVCGMPMFKRTQPIMGKGRGADDTKRRMDQHEYQ